MLEIISLGIASLSLGLSLYALVAARRPGPTGAQGERGLPGTPGISLQPIVSPNHTKCITCGNTVARFTLTAAGPQCANCFPMK
jgi:hypothetical protein